RLAVTLATVVSSALPAFGPATMVMRTLSPGRMSGVVWNQHELPGWLNSTMPAKGAPGAASGSAWGEMGAFGSVLSVVPFGWVTVTTTRSSAAYPLAETKSRCG